MTPGNSVSYIIFKSKTITYHGDVRVLFKKVRDHWQLSLEVLEIDVLDARDFI